MTNLTAEEAKKVAEQPFVDFVNPVTLINSDSFGAIPPPHTLEKRINNGLDLQERKNSDDHLNVISQMKDAALDNYIFVPLLGRGQTIYVLDTGFNTQHEEFGPPR
jgi:hypothetical protein